MKSLSNHSAIVDQSPGIPPKLQPFKELTGKLSRAARQGCAGAIVLGLVFGIAPSALAHYMRLGARGPGVARVQAQLGIPADGIFGFQTKAAVIAFQRACGLAVDGIVGPETLSALHSGCCVVDCSVSSGHVVDPVVPDDGPISWNEPRLPGIQPPSTVLPPAVIGPYVVIVPDASPSRLAAVQRIVPNSVIDGANQGSFINAGGYPNYASALEVANRLRGFGFDARVDYFERYLPFDGQRTLGSGAGSSSSDFYEPAP
ncbi:MAG: peptidoglycan-binding protein [Synechococcales cyanobacterium C42_A2020_086]|nr:peptidoglycan-binding protein [Synechococcales cyanobacterium M58_A2018_015]MBF2073732.1 peptidoglycan-binding protein [Synechococcales cyanobacterium C42_A2020_086]